MSKFNRTLLKYFLINDSHKPDYNWAIPLLKQLYLLAFI